MQTFTKLIWQIWNVQCATKCRLFFPAIWDSSFSYFEIGDIIYWVVTFLIILQLWKFILHIFIIVLFFLYASFIYFLPVCLFLSFSLFLFCCIFRKLDEVFSTSFHLLSTGVNRFPLPAYYDYDCYYQSTLARAFSLPLFRSFHKARKLSQQVLVTLEKTEANEEFIYSRFVSRIGSSNICY